MSPKPTIEQELALVAEERPDFAPRVVAAIEQMRVNALSYTTCFYGQVCIGDHEEAKQLCRRIYRKLGLPYCESDTEREPTPVEVLITGAYEDETHETHEGLATLHTALKPIFRQRSRVHDRRTRLRR